MTRRIPDLFVPSHVRTQFDPALMEAGPMAELLFRRGNDYAAANGRDGVLLRLDLPIIGAGIPSPAKAAKALEDTQLWVPLTDGRKGWLIRSFLKWNPTQEEQALQRERKTLGAHRTNHARGRHEQEPEPACPDCQSSL